MGQARRRVVALAVAVAAVVAAPVIARADAVDDYGSSWIHRALGLQYDLSSDAPLRNHSWVSTHNSYNSKAELGENSLSANDANQQLTIADQLALDVRGLEIDTHWFLSQKTGQLAPVVCHARPANERHFGCSGEELLAEELAEIAAWLRRPANREEVIFLYLEDHLENDTGYNTGGEVVRQQLGDLLLTPASGTCTELDYDLSRDDILAAGKQIFIVSDCRGGTAWDSVIFNWDSHEEGRVMSNRPYSEFPECGQDYPRAEYQEKLIRYYEDSTRLTATAGTRDLGLTPKTTAQMARCGVDLFGFDQLQPFDGRLESMVWSWAPGHPLTKKPRRGRVERVPGCAAQRVNKKHPFGRWFSKRCGAKRRPACRKGERWVLASPKVAQKLARKRCRARGAVHAVPRTGYEAQLLRLAMQRAKVREAWLGYKRKRGRGWVRLDRRS